MADGPKRRSLATGAKSRLEDDRLRELTGPDDRSANQLDRTIIRKIRTTLDRELFG